ncbi:DNA-binding protein [Pectobacterium versatile]|uniref:DNA-binding protein n=1 Tax=Pectobacterium versatile TaxID=2488639 RepID=UPI00102ED7F6|nr:DNA-binding protein [Pectobacterium versatile]TAI80280.1 DNA-binding protein [Pectobacterium versatile]
MAQISISEASRLTGKSRTTLHKLIKAGELSTCRGERNAKLLETSELLRVFGAFNSEPVEQVAQAIFEQRGAGDSGEREQVVQQLQQEVEHLRELLSAQSSHIDSLKQAMLLLEHKTDATRPATSSTWWRFWKK